MDGFLNIVALMTTLTHKNVKFEWMGTSGQSFQELKKQLVTAPSLTILEGDDGLLFIMKHLVKG